MALLYQHKPMDRAMQRILATEYNAYGYHTRYVLCCYSTDILANFKSVYQVTYFRVRAHMGLKFLNFANYDYVY